MLALPKLIDGANSETLSQALAEHLVETGEHLNRLEEIFTTLEKEAKPWNRSSERTVPPFICNREGYLL